MPRCPKEQSRLGRLNSALPRKLKGCGRTSRCRALRGHIQADMKELRGDLAAGHCIDAAIVLDHLELIARKG